MRRQLLAAMLALPIILGTLRCARAATDPGPVDPTAPLVPLNFTAAAYARGLDHPGPMLVLPNGDVLVSVRGGVSLLRDRDANGTADTELPLVSDLGRPLGLALRRDKLYVATADGLHSCTYFVGRQHIGGHCHPLATWPDGAGAPVRGGLAFNRDETTLYVALAGGVEPAGVWVVQPDGKGARRYATLAGTALALEPSKGALWTTDGAPSLIAPGDGKLGSVPLAPHGPVTGLGFYGRDRFPTAFRGGLFVAEGGDGDAAPPRISYVPFAGGRPTGAPTPFVTGFQHGRPDALAASRDGALLVADELRGTVWRVAFRCGACTPDPAPPARRR
jgi:glucose/arabinose dehydrogenase